MEFIAKSRILQFNPDQLNYVRKQYNLHKPGDMVKAIDVLEAWVKEQKHFAKREFPRNYLEKAIITSKGSIERAKSKLDKICTFRTVMPHFFGENLTKNRFENAHIFRSVVLPKPTDGNHRVYILKVVGSTFTCDIFMDCYRYIVMICEYVMAYDYSEGVIVVIDYTEANLFEIIKSITLTEVSQIFTIATEGYGMRLHGINILTSSKAIDTFVGLLKQLLSPKLGNRISTHKNISSLYQCISRDILPVEYGGKEKSLTELHDNIIQELTRKEFRTYLEEMDQAKTDESCRQIDTFNEHYLGMPGSFRTLNVD